MRGGWVELGIVLTVIGIGGLLIFPSLAARELAGAAQCGTGNCSQSAASDAWGQANIYEILAFASVLALVVGMAFLGAGVLSREPPPEPGQPPA